MAGRAGKTGLAAVLGPSGVVDQASKDRPLTEQQERLVELLAAGQWTVEECGEMAGYGTRQSSHRAAHLSHVQVALRERLMRNIALAAPAALHTLTTLARGAETEKVRADAAKSILDRAGLVVDGAGGGTGGVMFQLILDPDLAKGLGGAAKPIIEGET